MAPAMSCKTCKKSKYGDTRSKTNDFKSKFACILEACESTRMRIEESIPNHHEDHVAGKGDNHYSTTIWFTNLFLCLKQWRYPQQKQQWIKNVRNLKTFPRGTWQKSETNQRWSMKQGRRALQFILHHLWTYVIWKMLNWMQSTQNTKVVLYSEATLWKMILDFMQYLHYRTRIISITNDGNISHGYHIQIARMRRANSWRSICLYPGQNGWCSKIIENSQIGMSQTLGFVCHDTNGPNHGPVWKIQSFLLSEICMVILWQDCFWKGNLRESSWKIILICVVDDIKFAGKKQNIHPMWKVLNKGVDLGEPTSFLDHVYLGCTQRQCEKSKDIVDNYRTMFESRISAGATEKLPCSVNLRISSWSYGMEGHAKKCVEGYCELANKTTQQLYKVSTPCIDDHHFKEEETKSVGELSNTCSQIVLKCLYLARIGRPDILWSVNKLARSITKWTKACDKRLIRLLSYIHHTSEYKQYCHVGNTAKQWQIGTVSRLWFAGRSWRFKIHFWRNIMYFWKSYICSNKLDVRSKLQFRTVQQNQKSFL